jgi:lipopolysaccharide biosynthesis protein/SAM-dependent methyltransferase
MKTKQNDISLSTDVNTKDGKILHYIQSNSAVLEFGPAYGRMTKFMKETLNCKVYIVEIDKDAYKSAIQYAVKGICGDILEFSWLKEFGRISFDHIIFANVLEHLWDPWGVLEKSLSLLKDDGSVLLSVPNLAHNSVLINLFDNKFEYTNVGLLDKKHIRFFTHSSLVEMLEDYSLVPVVEDGTVYIPEKTELQTSFFDIPERIEILEQKEYANIYQFVFKCVKKKYYLANKKNSRIEKLYGNTTSPSFCNIYFDTGANFNSEEILTLPFYMQNHHFEVTVTINPDCKGIRFDPFEEYACILYNLQIITDNGVISHTCTNGIELDGIFVFDTLDPQIVVDFKGRTYSKIKISGDIYRYSFDNISLISKSKHIFEKYFEVKSEIDNLLNSRSWRFTEPLRKVTAFIRRHKALYFFVKGLLSLKRIGIKGTVKKVINKEKKIISNTLLYESEYQENLDFSKYKPKVKAIAFYLPQFHVIPENDEWWGKGFTEWTNTRKAKPRFTGHYQPREPHDNLGYYDLTDIETIKKQVKLAKQHGIYGFCFYYYWFSGKRLLDKPLDLLLSHPEIDINFCLCWANENWTRRWDGLEKNILIGQNYTENDPYKFIEDIQKYISDKRYIRVEGKPVILVYRPEHIRNIREVFNKWRTHSAEIGIGKIQILICNTWGHTAYSLHIEDIIDGAVEFPPHHILRQEIKNIHYNDKTGAVYNYEEVVLQVKKELNAKNKKTDLFPIYRTCMLGWDNAPRKKKEWFSFAKFSLKSFFEWSSMLTENTVQAKESIFFINAWNEWGEGTYLEPDKKYGYANINTLSKAIYGLKFNYIDPLIYSKYNEINKEFMSKDNVKICVQVHLYYLELIDEIISNLNYIPFPFHCFVSSDTDEKVNIIQNEFDKKCKNAKIINVKKFENKGRDIAPFLEQMKDEINKYEYLLHIHTKKTITSSGYGDDWRKYLYKYLLGSTENIYYIFNEFFSDEKLGLFFPENYSPIIEQMVWGTNIKQAKKNVNDVLKRAEVSIKLRGKPEFPAGDMFWARIKSIKKMFTANINQNNFPVENNQRDMTLAHAIERSWVYIAKSEGYTYKQLNNSNMSN